MSVQTNIWDKKAKNYAKFNQNLNEFQLKFFNVLDKFGVKFDDKTLIDIGCGTGVYTLHLAKKCKNILAIDSSVNMLNELNKKINEFSIKNVITKLSSFDEFYEKIKFDIAFLTMSPALKTDQDYEKFINLANLRVYMNWQTSKTSTMLEPFYQIYGKNDLKKNMSKFLQAYLEKKGIPYKTEILEETRTANRSLEEALENTLWHLEINGVVGDKNKIKNILKTMIKNGVIKDEIHSRMRILVF